jgi:hypothetical protein
MADLQGTGILAGNNLSGVSVGAQTGQNLPTTLQSRAEPQRFVLWIEFAQKR